VNITTIPKTILRTQKLTKDIEKKEILTIWRARELMSSIMQVCRTMMMKFGSMASIQIQEWSN